MRWRTVFSIGLTLLVVLVTACGQASNERRFTLQGQVIAIAPNHLEATIKHEEIKSFMPAMTMPYKVKDGRLLDTVAPGDLINAVLVVTSNDAFLTEVRKVGEAPIERPLAEAQSGASSPSAPSSSSASPGSPGSPGSGLLAPGE